MKSNKYKVHLNAVMHLVFYNFWKNSNRSFMKYDDFFCHSTDGTFLWVIAVSLENILSFCESCNHIVEKRAIRVVILPVSKFFHINNRQCRMIRLQWFHKWRSKMTLSLSQRHPLYAIRTDSSLTCVKWGCIWAVWSSFHQPSSSCFHASLGRPLLSELQPPSPSDQNTRCHSRCLHSSLRQPKFIVSVNQHSHSVLYREDHLLFQFYYQERLVILKIFLRLS